MKNIKMPDKYYCRRIQSQVKAEKINDVKGRITVACQYYTRSEKGANKYPCIKNFPNFRRCLVKLVVQREE